MSQAVLAFALVYVLLNLVSFFAYGWDKHKAEKGAWRTRESTLLVLGLLGPWGSIGGMRYFHHKTQKPKFRLNYLFAFLHLVLFAVLIDQGFFSDRAP